MLEKVLVMDTQERHQDTKIGGRKMMFFVSFLVALAVGLLVYTIFTDGPDIVRGTKSIKTLSIFSNK